MFFLLVICFLSLIETVYYPAFMTWQLVKKMLPDNHSQFHKFVVKISIYFFFVLCFRHVWDQVKIDELGRRKKNIVWLKTKKKKRQKNSTQWKKDIFVVKMYFHLVSYMKKIHQINKELWRQTLIQNLSVTSSQVIKTRENYFATCPSGLPYPCEHYKLWVFFLWKL